jgi:hypothetical protein
MGDGGNGRYKVTHSILSHVTGEEKKLKTSIKRFDDFYAIAEPHFSMNAYLALKRPESQSFGYAIALFEETRTRIGEAFIGKAYLIGSICPEDGFWIMSRRMLFFGDR